jgi:predicted acylesterase/phospholipase RssA
MRVAARATSAAPTYFRPLWNERHAFVDGGVFANNPARLGWMAKRDPERPDRPILLVSLGTGAAKSPDPSKRRFWGPLPWARPMIDLLLTAPSDLVQLELEEAAAATPALEYFRLAPDISHASPRMDDVDPANLAALDRAADALIAASDAQLQAIAARV